ncbi:MULTISPECIES: hypothetical protein [Thiomicrorhabdus]|uniref:DUF1292 domain-containing protein n=1 Tax=Thiomicrorhabdus heinhorstiae TaxID=2748010 RepID=A0ABS0BSW1_9GAMM|nr:MULTISPECIES: hypothetical protein [Thiomicrorhabdus]MBF6056884.1 hypothetical protein [Thiomicrorhabdus heinhorstiae]
MSENIKTGIYEVTVGEYVGAAILLMDVSDPEESEFVYLTIFNPDTGEDHEITNDEWKEMVQEDGLQWIEDIPDEIKDQYLFKQSHANIADLT